MTKTVQIKDLQVGMYVIIPLSWVDHSFTRSRFLIKNSAQIEKIREHGLHELQVDLSKSNLPTDILDAVNEMQEIPEPALHKPEPAKPDPMRPPPSWTPENLVPEELLEAIDDQRMDSNTKARVVYKHSLEMMSRLLDSPTAENIHASKDAIKSITNMILSDDDTSHNLLRITTHDFYTYTHSVNVGVTAVMLAKELFRHSDAHDLGELGAGFFLHDLGKVNVDSRIINKPARLNEEEMNQMRTHPYQGYRILKEADALSDECKYIVLQHHELYDGSGYPKRLKGDDIHIYGRICCLADVFEALTAERSYKQSMTRFDALKLMRDEMPNHFRRDLLNAFIMLFK
jgi:HD-GYP domain-containing protein (c-di-GMP phosphodiesterase class II)